MLLVRQACTYYKESAMFSCAGFARALIQDQSLTPDGTDILKHCRFWAHLSLCYRVGIIVLSQFHFSLNRCAWVALFSEDRLNSHFYFCESASALIFVAAFLPFNVEANLRLQEEAIWRGKTEQ